MAPATLVEIGKNIESRRRDLRIKQAALAAEVGMSQPNLSRIECGEQEADEYQLRRIATALQCTVADLRRPSFVSV